MSSAEARPPCAEVSRADEEPLAATASRVDTWLLVEYRGLWGHDAAATSTLSPEVKAHLRALGAASPRSRLLFVRRSERRGRPTIAAFVARSTEGAASVRRLELDGYDDLLAVDLETAGEPVDHPVLLVCTHGKHDRCCAKFGRPLYEALRDIVDEEWVWQSTHVGGDRFAGNVVSLPHGLYYGRVDPAAALTLAESVLERRIELEHYRGRSCYSMPVQAAERAVREATGALGVEEVRLVSERSEGDRRLVVFAAAGAAWEVEVRREEGQLTHLTCDANALRRPRRYVAGTPRERAA